MQMRENAATTEFEGILEEEVRDELREIATISMGTEISGDDISNITSLCDQALARPARPAPLSACPRPHFRARPAAAPPLNPASASFVLPNRIPVHCCRGSALSTSRSRL